MPLKKQDCPCGSGQAFEHCCGPYLRAQRQPATAESLMRSRYTAYVCSDETYLLQTWHPTSRPHHLSLTQPPIKWLSLKIIRTDAGGPDDDTGVVEFIARYKTSGKAERLHETSQFVKESGRWFYLQALSDNVA
jgi:SEC-C motif-containing protein